MSERPFMQLYVSDFVGDTLMLSAEHVGAYLLLLMAAFRNGGTLPADEAKLARAAKLSPAQWREAWPEIEPFFVAADGILISRHLAKWIRDEKRLFGRRPLPPELRRLVLERDGARCHYCGDTVGPFHIDHVHPVALGGTDDPGNLKVACATCNMSKGAKTIEEWMP